MGVAQFTIIILSILGLCSGARRFPDGFKFGAATASYQVEGAWNVSGKGENIWDRLTHTTKLVKNRDTGDVACDSYNNYKRDVEMLKELGVDYYRFSLSWSRIMPTGHPNKINADGLRYYNALIDELLANGIEPVVTLYHWDLPQALQELGGWTNALIVDFFLDYAAVAFEAFGDRVKMWLTFNEAKVFCLHGYGFGGHAPALQQAGVADYMCAHNVLRSHGKTYRMYDQRFRPSQRGRVSLTIDSGWNEPTNETAEEVGHNAMEFELGWFGNAIFSADGDYPQIMKDLIYNKSMEQGFSRSRLPEFTQEEINYIRGSYDFFGLNHYSTNMVRLKRPIDIDLVYPRPSYWDDKDSTSYQLLTWPGSASSWLKVVPWGFTKLLRWIRTSYANPEVIIFENGFSDKGGLEDLGRINYYHLYLNALLDAVDEGSNITAYTAWSLMDNFEWLQGYTERFGMYFVDFEDPARTRTPKLSASYYKEIIETHSIDEVSEII